MQMNSVTIQDSETNATARIAVGFGFNCFDFQVQRGNRSIPVLWSAPDFDQGTARPSGSGIPILFPFPGRIHGTVLRWQDREYALKEGDGRGNAIHGFVLNRSWRLIEQSPTRVLGEFQASLDDPTLLQAWPADFRIRVSYELRRETLRSEIEISNPGSQPLPCGLGTHPYFRLPLGGGSADECVVKLPVTSQWELRDMVTTGERSPLRDAGAFQQGRKFGELRLDNVFSGLQVEGDRVRSQILDPKTGIILEQSFDASFKECVVYTPPHREAICIEPYTCAPGCFDLEARGIAAGLKILQPGEVSRYRIEISVRGGA